LDGPLPPDPLAPGGSLRGPGWFLRARGFDPATARHWEGLFTQGSGTLHLRGSLEEPVAGAPQNRDPLRSPGDVTSERFAETPARWGVYVPGVFAEHPRLGHEMVNLPFFAGWTIEVGGEVLAMGRSRVEEHERTLDLRDGRLRRELLWRAPGGVAIRAIFERFLSAARPHACLQRLLLEADREVEVEVSSFIDADVRTNGFDHFASVECDTGERRDAICRVETNGGDAVEILSRFLHGCEEASGSAGDRQARTRARRRLSPGDGPLCLEKRSLVRTSRDLGQRPLGELVGEIAPLAFEELARENRAAWEERWRASEVLVEGDPESRLALRTSIHHLLRSHVPGDARVAIDAKGYAGEAYYGRFFWDTEVCLLPFFLYTDPARARTLVDFRLSTLEGARENARSGGFRGARYAWESSTTGVEQCPAWPFAEQEIHVTADAVYGFAHYAAVADPGYLEGPAAEAIVETARFWVDRIEERGDGSPALTGVLGPDEYTPSSTNNAYTNRMVRFALGLAAVVGARGGASSEERERFAALARGLPVPRSADGELVLQCEEFEELEELDLDALWTDRSRPLAAQVPIERLYRSRVLKQADVLMMMALFPDDFEPEEVRAAWDRYEPITTHDSSLSAGVHGLVASRLGLSQEAWAFWLSARDRDLDPSRGGAAEGIHVASAAGLWTAAAMGFAGLKSGLWTETLTLDPHLPERWGRLAFPLVWRRGPVRIDVRRGSTRVTNLGERAIGGRVAGESRSVSPGATGSFRTGEPGGGALEAVLLDLDGVLVTTDRLHFAAWSELARREGISFDWETNHRLRGVSRRESLEIILERSDRDHDEEQKAAMLEFKNGLYRRSLSSLGAGDVLPGALELLAALRQEGIRTAVVSASRNAPAIFERVGLQGHADVLVDGGDTSRSKPDPEGFLLAARRLGVAPAACLVVEDAAAGVESALRAGMAVLAVGDRVRHPGAPSVVSGLEEVSVADLRAMVGG